MVYCPSYTLPYQFRPVLKLSIQGRIFLHFLNRPSRFCFERLGNICVIDIVLMWDVVEIRACHQLEKSQTDGIGIG